MNSNFENDQIMKAIFICSTGTFKYNFVVVPEGGEYNIEGSITKIHNLLSAVFVLAFS